MEHPSDDTAPGPADITLGKPDDAIIEAISGFNIAMAMETESRELDPARVRRGVAAVLKNPQLGFYLVAQVDDAPVGSLMVTNEWSDWRDGMFWWIQSVYVAPAQRGRGIYRQLYEDVLARAMNDGGVCGIRLYVERDNKVAQDVYRALGMSSSGYLVFEHSLPPT